LCAKETIGERASGVEEEKSQRHAKKGVSSNSKVSSLDKTLQLQKTIGNQTAQQMAQAKSGNTPTRGASTTSGSTTTVILDTEAAQIDESKSIDEITLDFYHIPIELLPPNVSIPEPPVLTVGKFGCSIRRHGLTFDNFSITYTMDDSDIQHDIRPFMPESGLSTVECWLDRVQFMARLRQTIFLPNDLATHPCAQGGDPAQKRDEILAHERLHESDNNLVLDGLQRSLKFDLSFTAGIGRSMAIVQITDDPDAFVSKCGERILGRLDELQSKYEIWYARESAEAASNRDPHDRELHMLKLRLLEEASARSSR
jgi:hypothetical protein